MSSEHKEGGGSGLDVRGKWTRSEKERVWGMEGKLTRETVRLQSSTVSPAEMDPPEFILGPRYKALWLSSGTGEGIAGFSRHVARGCASKYFKNALEVAMGVTLICSSGISTPRTDFKLPL